MESSALRVRQKDAFYRIEEPGTGLCVRFTCAPSAPDSAPQITPLLTSPALATWFPTRAQAVDAFQRYIGVAPFEIVRADA